MTILPPDENSALGASTATFRSVMQAIVRLYETVHQHVPDGAELNFWTSAFINGEANLTSLAGVLLKSDDFSEKRTQDKEALFQAFLRNALGGESDITAHPDLAWRQSYLERDSSELAAMISGHPAIVEHIQPYVDDFLSALGEPRPFTGSVYQIPPVKPNPAPVLPAALAPEVVDAVIMKDGPAEEIERSRVAKEAVPENTPAEFIKPPTEMAPTSSEDLAAVLNDQRGTAPPILPGVDELDPSRELTGEPLPVTDPPALERDVPMEVEDERPWHAPPQSSPPVQGAPQQQDAQVLPTATALSPAADVPVAPTGGDAPVNDALSEHGDPSTTVKTEETADRETVPYAIPVAEALDVGTAAIDIEGDNHPTTDPIQNERSDTPPAADDLDTPLAADEPDMQAVRWNSVPEPQVIAARLGETIGLRQVPIVTTVTYEGSEGPDDRASIIVDHHLGALRVDGIEHINIVVRGEGSLSLQAAQAKTITIGGQGTFKLALADDAPVDLTTVDASALQGKFLFSATETQPLHVLGASGDNEIALSGSQDNVVKTSSGNDVIRTGGGADEIHTGGGSDTVSAGGGDDVIILGSGAERIEFATDTTSTLSLGNGNMAKLAASMPPKATGSCFRSLIRPPCSPRNVGPLSRRSLISLRLMPAFTGCIRRRRKGEVSMTVRSAHSCTTARPTYSSTTQATRSSRRPRSCNCRPIPSSMREFR
jgi:hypothetical protein